MFIEADIPQLYCISKDIRLYRVKSCLVSDSLGGQDGSLEHFGMCILNTLKETVFEEQILLQIRCKSLLTEKLEHCKACKYNIDSTNLINFLESLCHYLKVLFAEQLPQTDPNSLWRRIIFNYSWLPCQECSQDSTARMASLAEEYKVGGFHLPSHVCLYFASRHELESALMCAKPGCLKLGASCHSLAQAEVCVHDLQLDFITASQVKASKTCKGRADGSSVIGWDGLKQICAHSEKCAVYGLGGLGGIEDFEKCKVLGAHGMAAISFLWKDHGAPQPRSGEDV
eukprot:Nk52_evm6s370 gene=Nk52_evmTU6s370